MAYITYGIRNLASAREVECILFWVELHFPVLSAIPGMDHGRQTSSAINVWTQGSGLYTWRCLGLMWAFRFNSKLNRFLFRYRHPVVKAVDVLVALWDQFIRTLNECSVDSTRSSGSSMSRSNLPSCLDFKSMAVEAQLLRDFSESVTPLKWTIWNYALGKVHHRM